MTSCPTCKRQAKPQARYCPACYFVFPSDSANRNLAAARAQSSSWRGATLFFAVMASLWVLQIGLSDPHPEPGSFQQRAQDRKQELNDWFARTIGGKSPTEAGASSHALQDIGAAGLLDNSHLLPCGVDARCEVVIRFDTVSAAYVIKRSRLGARIVARDRRGTELLSNATHGDIVAARPRRAARSVSIVRRADGRWTVVQAKQFSTANRPTTPAGKHEGVS